MIFKDKEALRTYFIVVGIAVFFLLWGAFIFFTVGDKEPAEWDYHVISDVPGESPYSTRVTKHFFGIPIQPFQPEMKSKPEHEPGQGEKK